MGNFRYLSLLNSKKMHCKTLLACSFGFCEIDGEGITAFFTAGSCTGTFAETAKTCAATAGCALGAAVSVTVACLHVIDGATGVDGVGGGVGGTAWGGSVGVACLMGGTGCTGTGSFTTKVAVDALLEGTLGMLVATDATGGTFSDGTNAFVASAGFACSAGGFGSVEAVNDIKVSFLRLGGMPISDFYFK